MWTLVTGVYSLKPDLFFRDPGRLLKNTNSRTAVANYLRRIRNIHGVAASTVHGGLPTPQ